MAMTQIPAETTARPAPRIRVELVDHEISLQPLRDFIVDADTGAHAWFEGVTRRMTGSLQTILLSYEAFVPMATRQLNALAEEAAARFSLTAIAITHRLGEVPVGEASIVIGCSAAHRVGPLAALPWLMDRIKADVVVWKREHFADGQTQWIHPR
jgi:molybdopterin synthase catalytic subunit